MAHAPGAGPRDERGFGDQFRLDPVDARDEVVAGEQQVFWRGAAEAVEAVSIVNENGCPSGTVAEAFVGNGAELLTLLKKQSPEGPPSSLLILIWMVLSPYQYPEKWRKLTVPHGPSVSGPTLASPFGAAAPTVALPKA